ncbi:site-specific recombinase XerD [Bradyrhizobium sp. USDA 4501]
MLDAIETYLALRRTTGFAMSTAEYLLKSFAAFPAERGQTYVETKTAIDWAALGPSVAQRDARLRAVCRFVRHVRVEDVGHELPPANHFGARKKRGTPHIYTTDEISRLVEAALRLRPTRGLRPHTQATLIALLSSTGLRISEALKLTIADVTRDGLLIRETKFRKTRLVPLHDTAAAGLQRYLARRGPGSDDDPVFIDKRVGRYATLPSRRPSTGWSTRLASDRRRLAVLACTIYAHVCGARAARQPYRPRPVRGAHGGTRDLHGSRQHLCDLLVSRGHARPLARRRHGRRSVHVRREVSMTPIAPLIETFLRDTLACQRGASRHTRDSYASSFQLLFVFAADRLKVKPSALTLEQIDAGLVSAFLQHLEDERKNAAVTRNVRLAAIKSFFRFLEYRQPAALEQIRRVLAIPFKKTDTRLVPYLLREELQAVLDAPDPATRDGIRDRAMLHVAVCAGLRVSELTGLKVDDIDLPSMSIRVLGKGRRERTLPLWKPAAAALRAWLAIRGQVATPEVFVNARGEPLSRWGFAYLLRQHAATAARKQPGLAKKRVSPHVLRHTCAMVVLQATGDIRKVSLWLGHATLTTTEVYTRGDPTEKLDAMEAIVPPHLRRGVFQPTDQLIELLRRTS